MVLDALPDPVFLHDPKGCITRANRAYAIWAGLDFRELIGKPYWQVFPKGTGPLCTCARAMATPSAPELDETIEAEGCVFVSRSIPIVNVHGEYLYSMHIMEDITPLRDSAAIIGRSEEQFRLVSESIGEAFWMADISLERFYYVNRAYERIWGRSRSGLYRNARGFADSIHPDDRDRVLADLAAQETGQAFEHECRVVTPDGTVRWILNRGFPIDEAGRYRRYLNVSVDISAHKRDEAALKNKQEILDRILSTALEGFWRSDIEGRLLDVNAAYCRQSGYTREELLAMSVADLEARETSDEVAEHIRRNIELTGHGELFETLHRRKDGSVWNVEVSATYQDIEGGQFFVFVHDISARKQAEERLRMLNQELEARVAEETRKNVVQERMLTHQARHAAMGQMVGNIAHQWRQPLTLLALIVQNLRYDFKDGLLTEAEFDKEAAGAMRAIEQMSNTIDDFRDFFKPSQQVVNFSAIGAIEDTLEMVDASLANNGIEASVGGPREAELAGYPSEFGHVVLNLITNAKEALLERKIAAGRIEIGVAPTAGSVVVTVRDNAGGIAPENLEKIFDPYFSTKEGGTGIGLYMVALIVKQHMHGTVEAENRGEGAEFCLRFPRGS